VHTFGRRGKGSRVGAEVLVVGGKKRQGVEFDLVFDLFLVFFCWLVLVLVEFFFDSNAYI